MKNELLNILIYDKNDKSSLRKLFWSVYRKSLFWEYDSAYEDIQKERRQNIKEYRERLDNIYKSILVKS